MGSVNINHHWGAANKVLFSIALIVILAMLGYYTVYWWVVSDASEVLNMRVLLDQVTNNQRDSNVRNQLAELGYEINDDDFFSLNGNSSNSYIARVINDYEPEELEEVDGSNYYWHSPDGNTYYLEVGEDGKVLEENIIILNVE